MEVHRYTIHTFLFHTQRKDYYTFGGNELLGKGTDIPCIHFCFTHKEMIIKHPEGTSYWGSAQIYHAYNCVSHTKKRLLNIRRERVFGERHTYIMHTTVFHTQRKYFIKIPRERAIGEGHTYTMHTTVFHTQRKDY